MAILFSLLALVQMILLVPVPEKAGIVIESTVAEDYLDDHLDRVLYDEPTDSTDGTNKQEKKPLIGTNALKREDTEETKTHSDSIVYVGQKLTQSVRKSVTEKQEVEEINEERISFWAAWLLPKVLFYASAFFCAKFALYVVFLSLFEFLNFIGLHS